MMEELSIREREVSFEGLFGSDDELRAGLERSKDDFKKGRFIEHDEFMRELRKKFSRGFMDFFCFPIGYK